MRGESSNTDAILKDTAVNEGASEGQGEAQVIESGERMILSQEAEEYPAGEDSSLAMTPLADTALSAPSNPAIATSTSSPPSARHISPRPRKRTSSQQYQSFGMPTTIPPIDPRLARHSHRDTHPDHTPFPPSSSFDPEPAAAISTPSRKRMRVSGPTTTEELSEIGDTRSRGALDQNAMVMESLAEDDPAKCGVCSLVPKSTDGVLSRAGIGEALDSPPSICEPAQETNAGPDRDQVIRRPSPTSFKSPRTGNRSSTRSASPLRAMGKDESRSSSVHGVRLKSR